VVAGFPERPVRPRSRQGDPEEETWKGCCGGIQQESAGGEDHRLGSQLVRRRVWTQRMGAQARSRRLGMAKAFQQEGRELRRELLPDRGGRLEEHQ